LETETGEVETGAAPRSPYLLDRPFKTTRLEAKRQLFTREAKGQEGISFAVPAREVLPVEEILPLFQIPNVRRDRFDRFSKRLLILGLARDRQPAGEKPLRSLELLVAASWQMDSHGHGTTAGQPPHERGPGRQQNR
jgi:hypothetical protein